jgi:putative phage-type endonuclease
MLHLDNTISHKKGNAMLSLQQLKQRKLGIGGSDVAIIFGMSSYKTPYQLYLDKTEEDKIDNEMTEVQYWGNVLEPLIIKEFEKRNNVNVVKENTIVHPFHQFMRANIDGFIPEWNSVLEIKTSVQFKSDEWGEEGTDQIPIQYLLQVAHYCSCLNADNAHIAVLIGGSKYKQYLYERNFELEDKIIDACKYFWHCVQNKIPPEPINITDIKLMYPKNKELKFKKINPNLEKNLNKIIEIKQKIKDLTSSEENNKIEIMKYMEDAECLLDHNENPVITWKTNKRGTRVFSIKH